SDCIIERRDSRAPRLGQTGSGRLLHNGLTLLPTATTVREPAMSCCRSLVIVVLALALSAGSAGVTSLVLRCGHCGPHCPMSAKRLGCHDRVSTRHACQGQGRVTLTSCTHSAAPASALSWLALPMPSNEVRPLVSIREAFSPADLGAGRDVPEPLT